MNIVALFLVAAVSTQSVWGSYSTNQAYSYGSGYGHGGDYGYGHAGSSSGHGDLRYHGPTAIPHVLKDGHIADTHEVAAAKAAHYSAVSVAKAHSGYGYEDSSSYGGDYGYGGSYGHGNSHGYSSHGGYGQDYSSKYAGVYHTTPYHGPIAKPVVLKSGYLADTHEVAAAKEAHHKAVVSAKAHYGYGSDDSYGYGGDYGYGGSYGYGKSYGHDSSSNYAGAYHTAPYHGPLAKPVVLKSGYLADTHDVAVAKAHHLSALHSTASHQSYENKW